MSLIYIILTNEVNYSSCKNDEIKNP